MAFRCNKNLYCFWQQSQRTSSGWPHLASLTIETLREGHLPFSTYHCSLWLSRLSFYQDCSGIICTIAESVLFCSGRLCLCDFRRDSWFLYVTWCPMNIVRKMSLSKLKHWSSLRFIKPLKYKHEKKLGWNMNRNEPHLVFQHWRRLLPLCLLLVGPCIWDARPATARDISQFLPQGSGTAHRKTWEPWRRRHAFQFRWSFANAIIFALQPCDYSEQRWSLALLVAAARSKTTPFKKKNSALDNCTEKNVP